MSARIAGAAASVDFPNNSFSNQFRIRRFDDFSDKFVAGNPNEIHIAFQDFQVSTTNPCKQNSDEGFAFTIFRNRPFL
jgi:hypothetical protein